MEPRNILVIGLILAIMCLAVAVMDEYSSDPDMSGLVSRVHYMAESDETLVQIYLGGNVYIKGDVTDEIQGGESYDFWIDEGYVYRWNNVAV